METRFDVIGKSYEKALELYPQARTDAEDILKLLDLQGSETVLEISCGSGYLSMQLSPLLKEGNLIAQDVSPIMMELNQQKVKERKLKNVHFYRDENMALPELEDSSIDKAVCLGGFHHIEEPVKLFRTIRRVLRKGGVFVVGDFADHSPIQRYFDERIHLLTDTGHQGLFLTESQMVNFARFSNLNVVSLERKIAPFYFQSKNDVGIFYQLVHLLQQSPAETEKEVGDYMGIKQENGRFVVPMDYIYAKYQKD